MRCEQVVNRTQPTTIVYRAGAVCDALGTWARPGVVMVEGGRVVAAGGQEAGGDVAMGGARVVDMPGSVILPAMVSAHGHLDLTGVGRCPYSGEFVGWLKGVITQTRREGYPVGDSVRRGVGASLESGVGWLGDIAHQVASVIARREAMGVSSGPALGGVSYLECFGIGSGQGQAAGELKELMNRLSDGAGGDAGAASVDRDGCGVLLGVQPHAPYSAGLEVYTAAAELAQASGYRLSTHLAETPEEISFVRDARGPLVELLRDLGRWDDSIQPTGLHPVEWLGPVLGRGRWLLAHCNYVDDSHIALLAEHQASVAYCPVASDYFGHHRPDRGVVHRYRDMLAAGVNVCLGTDSVVCQRPDDPQPLSILSQMRHLYRRDKTDPQTLLAMATVNGMRALGLEPRDASLQPGSPARLVGVPFDPGDPTDAMVQVLSGDGPAHAAAW